MASKKILVLCFACFWSVMSKPTWPVQPPDDQQPFQPSRGMSAIDAGSDSDDDYNRQILGRPLGFIPLYMLPSTSRQRMRQQQFQKDGLESKLQPRSGKEFPERFDSPSLNRENLNVDPEQDRFGKNLIDPTSIHLPEGHPSLTVDQLLTGSSDPSQSGDSRMINPPELNRENVDTIDLQKQSTLIDPSSMKLPAGHPPVPLDDVVSSQSQPQNPSNFQGDLLPTKLEPFEYPAERHSDLSIPQGRERSLNPLDQSRGQQQVSPLDEPRAMPRQKRQFDHHVEHHFESRQEPFDRPYDGAYYDRDSGAFSEDYLPQRPRYNLDEEYDTGGVVDVFHHF